MVYMLHKPSIYIDEKVIIVSNNIPFVQYARECYGIVNGIGYCCADFSD